MSSALAQPAAPTSALALANDAAQRFIGSSAQRLLVPPSQVRSVAQNAAQSSRQQTAAINPTTMTRQIPSEQDSQRSLALFFSKMSIIYMHNFYILMVFRNTLIPMTCKKHFL
jgi:hypothetical protein